MRMMTAMKTMMTMMTLVSFCCVTLLHIFFWRISIDMIFPCYREKMFRSNGVEKQKYAEKRVCGACDGSLRGCVCVCMGIRACVACASVSMTILMSCLLRVLFIFACRSRKAETRNVCRSKGHTHFSVFRCAVCRRLLCECSWANCDGNKVAFLKSNISFVFVLYRNGCLFDILTNKWLNKLTHLVPLFWKRQRFAMFHWRCGFWNSAECELRMVAILSANLYKSGYWWITGFIRGFAAWLKTGLSSCTGHWMWIGTL